MVYEKRFDGRKFDELRPIKAEVGIIPNANGSAKFQIGNTVAICGIYGPREAKPRHMADPEKAILKCYYDMMTFSVPDRKNPGPGRREVELSLVIKRTFTPAIFLEEFPRSSIDIYMQIMQADAGTRCASICAASMALADAGIPMRGMVSAVSAGKVGGKVVLDLTKEEEDHVEGATDVPIAYMPQHKMITLAQLDGNVTKQEFKDVIALATKGCEKIFEIQKKTLKNKYKE